MEKRQSGVTLLEMLIVVTIIGVIAGVSFPAVATGLSGIQLQSAAGSVAGFLTSAMNRVDRREEPAAIVISPGEGRVEVFTAASGEKAARALRLPNGISVEGRDVRRYLLQPGGAVPKMSVVLGNDRGARRSGEIDPAPGVPEIPRVAGGQQ